MTSNSHPLILEEAWSRTISEQDRLMIQSLYETSALPPRGEVGFLPFRVAFNYKGDLLATVIIQNNRNEAFFLNGTTLQFMSNQHVMAEELFHFPQLLIQPHSSTPWTLIFPKEKLIGQPLSLHNWSIRIV